MSNAKRTPKRPGFDADAHPRRANRGRPVDCLFVYGTLLPAHANFHAIRRYVRWVYPATINGILVDLGAYPALIPRPGIVCGVVLELDPAALLLADHIESASGNVDQPLFRRRRIAVRLANGQIQRAWVYAYAQPKRIAARRRLVIGRCGGRDVYAWYDDRSRARKRRR